MEMGDRAEWGVPVIMLNYNEVLRLGATQEK